MEETKKVNTENGAVTFLDVLGWKGKWRESYEAIYMLRNLINKTKEKAEEVHEELAEKYKEIRGVQTEIISISDTIVLFTKAKAVPAIEIHGHICQWLIPQSISNKIPLRGASAYGIYSRDGNIMLGPAIDEAASWHEETNWIGVHLTPSALFSLGGCVPEPWTEYKNIPFKQRVPSLNFCVDWKFKEEEAIKLFDEMGPHIPGISDKYLNTMAFLQYNN